MAGAPDPKDAVRRGARDRRIGLAPEERARAAVQIVESVRALPEWQAARVVALYEPTGSEVDVSMLATIAAAEGRTVLVPEIVDRSAGHMVMVRRGGGSGGPAPEPELVVVPLVAFDRQGNRLGQGGGFYDRWLAGVGALRVGVAFSVQEVPTVPVGPHDAVLDVVVTETQVLRPVRRA